MKNFPRRWMAVTVITFSILFVASCKKKEESCWECFNKPKEECKGNDKCAWEAKVTIDQVWNNNNTASYQVKDDGRCMCEGDPIPVVEKASKNVGSVPFYPVANISCVAADRNNNLWVSNSSSTQLFNGTSWTTANITPYENVIGHSAPYSTVTTAATGFAVTGTNKIYAATAQYGLAMLDAGAGDNSWVYYETMNSSIPTQNLTHVYAESDSRIWIGTNENGILKFDVPGTWTYYNGTNSTMHSGHISCITGSSSGTIWFGSDLGFGKLSNGTVTEYLVGKVHAIACDNDGNAWAATDDGLKRWNAAANTMEYYGIDNSGLNTATVTSLTRDNTGKIWIGTHGGLYAYEGGKIVKYNFANEYQVGNMIHCISADQNNRIWIATENGVAVLAQ
jgi:ligand-binding sensor domain-containing protein